MTTTVTQNSSQKPSNAYAAKLGATSNISLNEPLAGRLVLQISCGNLVPNISCPSPESDGSTSIDAVQRTHESHEWFLLSKINPGMTARAVLSVVCSQENVRLLQHVLPPLACLHWHLARQYQFLSDVFSYPVMENHESQVFEYGSIRWQR